MWINRTASNANRTIRAVRLMYGNGTLIDSKDRK